MVKTALGVIWALSAGTPVSMFFYYLFNPVSGIEEETSRQLRLLPLAIQYVVSFAVTLIVTNAVNYATIRFVRRHGAANSELALTLDLASSAMTTTILYFVLTSCLQVSYAGL